MTATRVAPMWFQAPAPGKDASRPTVRRKVSGRPCFPAPTRSPLFPNGHPSSAHWLPLGIGLSQFSAGLRNRPLTA